LFFFEIVLLLFYIHLIDVECKRVLKFNICNIDALSVTLNLVNDDDDERPTGFLQCFDTVGLVIWPVKVVPDMTYNVFGGTLNLAQSVNRWWWCLPCWCFVICLIYLKCLFSILHIFSLMFALVNS